MASSLELSFCCSMQAKIFLQTQEECCDLQVRVQFTLAGALGEHTSQKLCD